MRKSYWWTMAALGVLLAGCSNDGQIIDASGEASGGKQAGGGALAFIFMVAVVVVIVALLFAMDRIRRRRLEMAEAKEAAEREKSNA